MLISPNIHFTELYSSSSTGPSPSISRFGIFFLTNTFFQHFHIYSNIFTFIPTGSLVRMWDRLWPLDRFHFYIISTDIIHISNVSFKFWNTNYIILTDIIHISNFVFKFWNISYIIMTGIICISNVVFKFWNIGYFCLFKKFSSSHMMAFEQRKLFPEPFRWLE